MCQIREKHIFGNLPVQTRFDKAMCGVNIIDPRRGLRRHARIHARVFRNCSNAVHHPRHAAMILNLQKTRRATRSPPAVLVLAAAEQRDPARR